MRGSFVGLVILISTRPTLGRFEQVKERSVESSWGRPISCSVEGGIVFFLDVHEAVRSGSIVDDESWKLIGERRRRDRGFVRMMMAPQVVGVLLKKPGQQSHPRFPPLDSQETKIRGELAPYLYVYA